MTSAQHKYTSFMLPMQSNTLISRRISGKRLAIVPEESTTVDEISPKKYMRRTFPSCVRTSIKTISLVFVLALSSVSIIKNIIMKNDLSSHVVSIQSTPSRYHEEEMDVKGIATLEEIQDTSAQQPIAWLMTWPNSGTTYTSFLVATVTGTHTATNYGAELHAQGVKKTGKILNHTSASVLTDTGNHIPVWSEYNWDGDSLKRTMNPPTKGYILTKTHCGGYCFKCSIAHEREQTIDSKAFTKACATGHHVIQNSTSGKFEAVKAHTDIEKVGRAVHIIRDPFDNVVARFHHHLKQSEDKKDSETLARYPSTRDGFRKFCHDLGRRWGAENENIMRYFELIKDVPCHSDFVRYIQWHNLAFATTAELGIPSMNFHYENYSNDFNKTKDYLLKFLHQDEVNPPPSFITGKTYRHYYTKEEIRLVSIMFDSLAHQETKRFTRHYFKD